MYFSEEVFQRSLTEQVVEAITAQKEQNGITYKALADKAGVAPHTIYSLKRAGVEAEVGGRKLRKLAIACGLSWPKAVRIAWKEATDAQSA